MKQELVHAIDEANDYLSSIRPHVIGIFRPNSYRKWDLVVAKEGDALRTIRMGTFLGIHDDTTTVHSGTYIPFPGGQTLAQMLDDPMGFVDWCKGSMSIPEVGY